MDLYVNRYDVIFLICLLSILIYSCSEPTEGCIDVSARNFDVSADVDCCRKPPECCCQYPTLSLNLFYKLTGEDTLANMSTNFKLKRYYALQNSTDSIRIDSFHLFISNIRPTDNSLGDSIQTLESIRVRTSDGQGDIIEQTFPDNIALVDFENFQYTLGTYRSVSGYNELNYNIGIPANLAAVDPVNVLDNHPLSNDYTKLYNSNDRRFISGRVGFRVKRSNEERFIVHEIADPCPITQNFALPILAVRGQNLPILLRINTLEVFKGIIFDVPMEDISLIINENLKSSISIVE